MFKEQWSPMRNPHLCARSGIDLHFRLLSLCGRGLWRGRVMMLHNQRDPLPGGPCVMAARQGAEDSQSCKNRNTLPNHKSSPYLVVACSRKIVTSDLQYQLKHTPENLYYSMAVCKFLVDFCQYRVQILLNTAQIVSQNLNALYIFMGTCILYTQLVTHPKHICI